MSVRTHGSLTAWCRSSATAARIVVLLQHNHQSSLRVGRAQGSPLLAKGHELWTCFHICHRCPKDLKNLLVLLLVAFDNLNGEKSSGKSPDLTTKSLVTKPGTADSHPEKAPEEEKGDKQGAASVAAAKEISVDVAV